jgi:hypothetical protein
MVKESTIRRSRTRAAAARVKPEDEAVNASDQVYETSNPKEPRRPRGRTDRRSSLTQLKNIQYKQFLDMIEVDPRSVFELCEKVCQEVVDEIECLYKE